MKKYCITSESRGRQKSQQHTRERKQVISVNMNSFLNPAILVVCSLLSAACGQFGSAQCVISIDTTNSQYKNMSDEVESSINNKEKRRGRIILDEFPLECSASQELSIVLHDKSIPFAVKVSKEVAIEINADNDGVMDNSPAHNFYMFGDHPSGSSINILRKPNGQVIGSIIDAVQEIVLQIRIDNDGNNFVDVTPSADFAPEADPLDDFLAIDEMTTGRDLLLLRKEGATLATPESIRRQTNTTPIIIDVMVLWTRKSECANAGLVSNCSVNAPTRQKMVDLIQLSIQETNTAYQLIGVYIQLDLVYSYRSDYVEPSSNAFSASLSSLRSQNDGSMDEVHSLREAYGADVVALIIDDSTYCGIGKESAAGDDLECYRIVTLFICFF